MVLLLSTDSFRTRSSVAPIETQLDQVQSSLKKKRILLVSINSCNKLRETIRGRAMTKKKLVVVVVINDVVGISYIAYMC